MSTTVLLESLTLPTKGPVDIQINRSFAIGIGAEQARRSVNRWLRTEISMSLLADQPLLFIGEQTLWKVPILLTAGHLGAVGSVGTVYVDIQTGVLNIDQAIQQEITERAVALAHRFADTPAVRDAPEEYIVTMKPTRNGPPDEESIAREQLLKSTSS